MRPLIEILEDERKLVQRREATIRFMERGVDNETFDILATRINKIADELDKVHAEMKGYYKWLLGE